MNAKDIIELMDETSAAALVKMYKKHGKAAVTKFQKLKVRAKSNQEVKWDGDKPVLGRKSAAQKAAGRKAGKKLHKGTVMKKKKLARNIRKATRANKIAARLGLK